MQLLTSKRKSKLKKLLISFFVFIFLFYSSLPALAATPTPNQKPVSVPTQTATSSSDTKTVLVPGGGTETGRVLCSVTDPLGCANSIIGGVGGALSHIGEYIYDFVKDKIFDILISILTTLAKIVDGLLGQTDKLALADVCTPQDVKCNQVVDNIAKYNPTLVNSTFNSNVNLMTLVDLSYSGLYNNIPDIHAAPAALAVFQNNLLGIGRVNAQGVGTKDLSGVVEEIWSVMRNVSYIFMAIVLVVIGFMVMLRRRLDPRTVVTATNSLPRVAVALILITFSFAISGLFVDLIYILVFLTRNALGGLPGIGNAIHNAQAAYGGGEFLYLPFFTLASQSIFRLQDLVSLLGAGALGALAVGPLALVPLLAVLLIDIIIRLGLFVLAIMLFWSLLTRFAQMVILVIFSPFFFLAGAVPGFETLTLSWFKRMLAVVITFPAILIIVYLAVALLSPHLPGVDIPKLGGVSLGKSAIGGAPPPIGSVSDFLNIAPLIGLGVLYFAHKIPGTIDEILGTKGSREKGIGPMVLVSGAMSGLQSYGAINKAAPTIGGYLGGVASRGGVTGRLAGGSLFFLRPFAGKGVDSVQDIMSHRAESKGQKAGENRPVRMSPTSDEAYPSNTGGPPRPTMVPPRAPKSEGAMRMPRGSVRNENDDKDVPPIPDDPNLPPKRP